MHIRHMLAVVSFALAACGPEEDTPPVVTPMVDPAFTGRWVGTTTLSTPGQAPFSYASSVDLIANGASLTARAFCPDSTGVLAAPGSGRSVHWNGSVTCALATVDCATAQLRYTEATASLLSNVDLNLSGAGVIEGCGKQIKVTSVFRGSK